MRDSFKSVAANSNNPNWDNMIKREGNLYKRENDIRSDFERDYTRILHCNAYRRLKHKTQVFFSPKSDHVCTRIEHVNYVESISNTIASYLGLNTQLTRAIATAHDMGHSPFGHKGEVVLNEICKRDIGTTFWHEKNGVHFVDDIELLEDDKGDLRTNVDIQDDSITYESPYAKYQYYGISKNGKPLNYKTPGTGDYWDERMKSAEIKNVVKEVQNYIGGKR